MGVLVFVDATASVGVCVVVGAVLISLEVKLSMLRKTSLHDAVLSASWLTVGATMGMSGNDG
jgi:hypothetical protein